MNDQKFKPKHPRDVELEAPLGITVPFKTRTTLEKEGIVVTIPFKLADKEIINKLKDSKGFISVETDIDEACVKVLFGMPAEWISDIALMQIGQYSNTSKEYQDLVINKLTSNLNAINTPKEKTKCIVNKCREFFTTNQGSKQC